MSFVLTVPVYLSRKNPRVDFLVDNLRKMMRVFAAISGGTFVFVDDAGDIALQDIIPEDIKHNTESKIVCLNLSEGFHNFGKSVSLGIDFVTRPIDLPAMTYEIYGPSKTMTQNIEVVATINDDIECTGSDLIDMYKTCRDSNSVVGPVMLYPDRRVQSMGSVLLLAYDGLRVDLANRGISWDIIGHRQPEYIHVGAVSGGFMFVPRIAWERLGGFDTSFQMGFEDVDFCFRAWKNNYCVTVYTDVVVTHYESMTRDVEDKRSRTGVVYLNMKWSQSDVYEVSRQIHLARKKAGTHVRYIY